MAGSSEDDNENYWPGYVDALTTMTMVLTFVMMVLGVMVFVLSQDITTSKLGVIARALNMQPDAVEKLTDAQVEAALRNAMSGPPEPLSQDMTNADPNARGTGGGQGLSKPATSADTSIFQSPFESGLIGNKAAGPGGEYLVTDRGGVGGAARGTGSRTEQGSGALRFVFERGAIDLPDLGDEAIVAFVAAQGRGPMTIRATAFPVEGGPSEARRRAYFRAMLVRTRFMKAGIRPQDIEIQVRDDIQASAQEVVDIFKKSGG